MMTHGRTHLRGPTRTLAACLLGAALLLATAGCGDRAASSSRGAVPSDDGRPHVPAAARSCAGKPSAGIGRIEARIVERPSEDRAVIEAAWTRGPNGHGHALELLLPDAAWIVDGRAVEELPEGERGGTCRWTVGFETGAPLDAVIRCAARVRDDLEPCLLETYVRLTGDPAAR